MPRRSPLIRVDLQVDRLSVPPNGWPLSCGRAKSYHAAYQAEVARLAEARGRQPQRLVGRHPSLRLRARSIATAVRIPEGEPGSSHLQVAPCQPGLFEDTLRELPVRRVGNTKDVDLADHVPVMLLRIVLGELNRIARKRAHAVDMDVVVDRVRSNPPCSTARQPPLNGVSNRLRRAFERRVVARLGSQDCNDEGRRLRIPTCLGQGGTSSDSDPCRATAIARNGLSIRIFLVPLNGWPLSCGRQLQRRVGRRVRLSYFPSNSRVCARRSGPPGSPWPGTTIATSGYRS